MQRDFARWPCLGFYRLDGLVCLGHTAQVFLSRSYRYTVVLNVIHGGRLIQIMCRIVTTSDRIPLLIAETGHLIRVFNYGSWRFFANFYTRWKPSAVELADLLACVVRIITAFYVALQILLQLLLRRANFSQLQVTVVSGRLLHGRSTWRLCFEGVRL